jgi:hypothetical protein
LAQDWRKLRSTGKLPGIGRSHEIFYHCLATAVHHDGPDKPIDEYADGYQQEERNDRTRCRIGHFPQVGACHLQSAA